MEAWSDSQTGAGNRGGKPPPEYEYEDDEDDEPDPKAGPSQPGAGPTPKARVCPSCEAAMGPGQVACIVSKDCDSEAGEQQRTADREVARTMCRITHIVEEVDRGARTNCPTTKNPPAVLQVCLVRKAQRC